MSEKECEICHEADFKYRCPRCAKKTCSLGCSKKHKVDFQCSGLQYDPQEYISSMVIKDTNEQVPKEDNPEETEINNAIVQRDYNFLINVNRQLSVLKNDTWTKNKRMLLGQQRNENTQVKKFKSAENNMELEFMHRRGCRCLLLPKGMKKSNVNRSKWDKPSDCFVWSLEWVISGSILPLFLKEEEEEEEENGIPTKKEEKRPLLIDFITHKNKETETLVDVVAKQPRILKNIVPKPVCNSEGEEFPAKLTETEIHDALHALIVQGNLKFYVKSFPKFISSVIDPKQIVEIDPLQKLSDCLLHKTCIEFPTIYVVVNGENNFENLEIIKEEEEEEKGKEREEEQTRPVFVAPKRVLQEAPPTTETNDESSDSDEAPLETPIVKKIAKNNTQPTTTEQPDSDSDSDDGTGITLDFLAD